jgi:hypothetical protein
MGEITGIITLVQERRFKLVDGKGRHQLLILAPSASADHADIERWSRAGTPVTVQCGPAPGLVAQLASDVRPTSVRPVATAQPQVGSRPYRHVQEKAP